MKIKTLFSLILLFSVLALADYPGNSRTIQFYSEELLRTRNGMEVPGYTSVAILKKRLEKLTICTGGQKGTAAYMRGEREYGAESLATKTGLSHRIYGAVESVDIPDMLVNQESYASSFNQNDPSVCMFPIGDFVTVWEDERNGDIDIFAQKYTFGGSPEGYNVELGEEDYPKDQFLPCVSLVDDTSFVVVWIDEERFYVYGRKFAKDLLPLDEVFQISDSPIPYTTWSPAVSSAPDGRFVVVWGDTRAGSNIYARRFDAEGNPVGASFKVNGDDGVKLHVSPKVSVGASGNFVIVWEDFRNTDADIFAQRFDSSGTEVGEDILVNLDSLSEDQYAPSVAIGPNDRFMVAWLDLRHGDGTVFARSFSFDNPSGDTVLFSVSSDTSSVVQESPPIVSDTLGRFTIAWTEYTPSDPSMCAQRFDSLGQAQGDAITLPDLPSASERHGLSISANPGGSFVAAWMDRQAGNYDIYAQRVNSLGHRQGDNLLLNDDEMGANQNFPQIVTGSDGRFVAVWEDMRRGNSDVFMRRFDQDAQALGDDHMVNDSVGRIFHGRPDVAGDSSGNLAVVWEDARESSLNIYAQLFDDTGNQNGGNFKVNCQGMANSSTPCCDMSFRGNFVVVWSSTNGITDNIYGRLFSSDGEALDTCFKINDDTFSVDHLSPRVAMDSSGGFVVAWQDRREGRNRIYLQRFASDGTRVGANFAVSSDRPDPVQYNADLDLNQRGDFVVTWTELYFTSTMIFAQEYDNSDVPVNGNIMVVDDPSAAPANPRASLTADGRFVIAWIDLRAQGSDIYFQTFSNGLPQGANRRVNSDPGYALQESPDIEVRNSSLYSVWRDNRVPGLGFSIFFNTVDLGQTEVEDQEEEGMVADFALCQNYPNPFNPITRIRYAVGTQKTQPGPVTLKIYNVLGQSVRTLADENKSVGTHEIIWDGKDDNGVELSSGIYFYQLTVEDQTVTRKMLLLR